MAHHVVKKSDVLEMVTPPEFEGRSRGYRGDLVVGEHTEAVHTGIRIAEIEPGGTVDTHLHSFEESFYVVEGDLVVDRPDGSFATSTGDYGLIPVGVPHAFRNVSATPVRFIEVKTPTPRERLGFDTYFPEPLQPGEMVAGFDVRDPRNRDFGHVDRESSDANQQTQDRLALSASMRTALLVYSGITVKMMIDSDLGADLSIMFMVQYEPWGVAGPHDHPLEEAYIILDGEVLSRFDGVEYQLGPGDVAWAGVGCVHEFHNQSGERVRWLETASPQPPGRHAYRFRRDWAYLEETLARESGR
jgi:mannose-6-phosphate isomerase-like protein (cupin superfamily)